MTYIAVVSYEFFLYLVLLLVTYYLLPSKIRWLLLFPASLWFYAQGGSILLLITGAVSLTTWGMAEIIEWTRKRPGLSAAAIKNICRYGIVLPYLLAVLAVLFFFKWSVFRQLLLSAAGQPLNSRHLTAPLGISYYTLSCIGYLLDVHWGRRKGTMNLYVFLTSVFYFAHITVGPVSDYNHLSVQLQSRHVFSYRAFCRGLQRMFYGLFKKLVLADRLALIVSAIFNGESADGGLLYLFALVVSCFQLYFDFSGCIDFLGGVSELFGIELTANFRRPFFAYSIEEFWRRWHISLGVWFRNYLFIPLASTNWMIRLTAKGKTPTSRQKIRYLTTSICLLTVWILTGLWHGFGTQYLVWGMYYGILMSLSVIRKSPTVSKKNIHGTGSAGLAARVGTFFVFLIGRLLTVPGNLKQSLQIIQTILTKANPWVLWDGTLLEFGLTSTDWYIVLLGTTLVLGLEAFEENGKKAAEAIEEFVLPVRWIIYYGLILSVVLLGRYGPGLDVLSFVYARF